MARKTVAMPRAKARYVLEILGQSIPVRDWSEASNAVAAIRDRTRAGASEMGAEFPIYERLPGGEEILVAYVSYNAKVWKGKPGDWPDVELIYDPYA